MTQILVTSENRKWWTLGAVALGLFMIMLDNTVVNVALPTIERDLGAALSELEWVVSGYALTFAALLLTGGKLADLFGRRLIFIVGLAIFAGSSLACALAPSAGFLIGARVVQGGGAALMNPATLSIITASFPPRQRGTAIGIWVGVSASALAIGPLLGGLLTEHAGWSSIFYVNVPIGVLAIVASLLLIDESKDQSHDQRLDLPGLLASGGGLFALTYGLIEATGSAVLNASRQVGGSMGIALMGAIMAHEIGSPPTPESFVHGLSVALEVAAAIAFAGAVVAFVLVRTHTLRDSAEEPARHQQHVERVAA